MKNDFMNEMINTFYFERKLVALHFWIAVNIGVAAENTRRKLSSIGMPKWFVVQIKPLREPFEAFWEHHKQDFLAPEKQWIKWV